MVASAYCTSKPDSVLDQISNWTIPFSELDVAGNGYVNGPAHTLDVTRKFCSP
jgi:hypothetical protein